VKLKASVSRKGKKRESELWRKLKNVNGKWKEWEWENAP